MASRRSPPGSKKDILANARDFPPFCDLPTDNELDMDYYEESPNGVWVCSRTWCFIAEIVDDGLAPPIPILRRRVVVRDRIGEELPIYFYPECGAFDYSTLKNGRTVAVMAAERHHFLDLTIGLRIENLDTIKVVNCRLEELFAMSKSYANYGEKRCWQCGEERPAEEIKKCGSCRCARYCDKQCQTKDWKGNHRKWCKALPFFMRLASIDYTIDSGLLWQ